MKTHLHTKHGLGRLAVVQHVLWAGKEGHLLPADPLPSGGALASGPVLPIRDGDVAVLRQGCSCRHGLCLHHVLQEWLPQELLPFDPPGESLLARATWHWAGRQPLQNDLLFAWECHPH